MKSVLKRLVRKSQAICGRPAGPGKSPTIQSLEWVLAHRIPYGGIRVHSRHERAYPEVTGYFIPTLLAYGEKELAKDFIRWLMCIQRPDGSFADPDQGRPHVFDTGQVLRGLLAGMKHVPQAEDAARRAADYLVTAMVEQGRGGFGTSYDGNIPESVQLYVLPPLIEAGRIFQKDNYRKAGDQCLAYYCGHEDFLRKGDLTHFLGYELESLIDLGRAELAKPVLDYLRKEQREDGSIRGIGGAGWVCTPGQAQLAICWYKIGEHSPADRAMEWLEKHQTRNGGFLGSYGFGADYFSKTELSWAVKFYLDAHQWRVRSFIDRKASIFPSEVKAEDGRLQALVKYIGSGDKVLEVGCGKGRFLKAIQEKFPQNKCTGADISATLMAYVPQGVHRIEGPMEALNITDNAFDVSFSVEAVEHSTNIEAAVNEMIRVTRPGGWVMIIDKERSQWGRLVCPSWERWPGREELIGLLQQGCDEVSCEPVGYDGKPADGFMMLWKGRKRSGLNGSQWNKVLNRIADKHDVLKRIQGNTVLPWGQEIILSTRVGQRVLEVGSGTGEMSLRLALAGRTVTVLDISEECLDFTRECAKEIEIFVETVKADATRPLKMFNDNQFECVWCSGLLEHFEPEIRTSMLKEWARISSDRVITLVPNAGCLAYRIGKTIQEEAGRWIYGWEMPIKSLRDEFEAVGLEVVEEYSLAGHWALNFMPKDHPLRTALADWVKEKTEQELRDMNQGYLLLTKGVKRK